MRIALWVRPGSARPGVGGEHNGALVVRVSAPAAGGQATEAALTAVAPALGIRRHAVTLIAAASGRTKIVGVQGANQGADSDRAMRLDETGLPARYYIPREDVRTELLWPARRKTTCPFKGQASYWSALVGGELYEDLVWSYETPIPAAQQIAGLMCFYNERVELTISDRHRPDPRASSFR